jgi:hypothetical protein
VRSRWRDLLLAVAVPCTVAAVAPLAVQAQAAVESTSRGTVRNPRALRATQLLEQRTPGTPARVRFEWDRIASAHEYVLTGRWTVFPSWTLHTRTYHVTRTNATSWNGERVTFEVALPEGSHSWQIVALLGPKNLGDYATPTSLSFDVR